MTQNLRLTAESLKENGHSTTLSSADTHISGEFDMPESDTNGFTEDGIAYIYYGGDDTYGAYYSWYTASVMSDGVDNNICPRGWTLPSKELYAKLFDNSKTWNTKTIEGNVYEGWMLDADKSTSAFWPAAGYHYDGASYTTNRDGYYWTDESTNDSQAYSLGFNENGYRFNDYSRKASGFSVRCVAEGRPSKDVDVIAVVVPPVISIDATSGMNKEVDPNLVTKGEISATISANTTYVVQLSTERTSLTNPSNSEEITSTNSIPASTNVIPKTNAWGILNSDNATYSAITSTPTTYYNTAEYNDESQSTKHTFGIGVSISPTLPAGEYSTTVTITAINN